MKQIILLTLTLILIAATGCTKKDEVNHHYVFLGENEDWTIQYEVEGKDSFKKKDETLTYEGNSDTIFTASYKKEASNLSTYDKIDISYQSSSKGGSISEEIIKDNPQTSYSIKSSSKSGVNLSSDDIIKVSINLDGNIQLIELHNKK